MELVFIVGTGRCGSTFLHELIARHRNVAYFSNLEERRERFRFLSRWAGPLYRNNHLALTRAGKRRFAPTEAYGLIGRRVSPIYIKPCRDLTEQDVTPWLQERFSSLFATALTRQRKSLFVHKYTGWSRIGFFASIFPRARFIHVVRDGRAVANSWLQMKWWDGFQGPENWQWGALSEEEMEAWRASGYAFTTLAGLNWRRLMESYSRAEGILDPERQMVLRYEDLLDNPAERLQAVLSFAGLEWTDDFARQYGRCVVRRSRREAFEAELTGRQLEEIEQCTAPMLRRYGYPVGTGTRPTADTEKNSMAL